MFRGKSFKGETQMFSPEEMRNMLDEVTAFNKQAMKNSVETAIELGKEDTIKPEQEFQVAMAMFDKLSLQTFSVVNNRAMNGMQ